MRPAAGLLAALVAFAAVAGVAHADGGEAGVVIQHGDGTIETACVAFEGDSIDGAELLLRAGVGYEQYAGLVCSLGGRADEACPGASNFESCHCKCNGPECTYWAFFTRKYGKGWLYSSLGFVAAEAKDGDLHAWKWGGGGPSSAPAPAEVTFEQVCGHAPRGGAAATVAPPTTAPTSAGAGSQPSTSGRSPAATEAPAASSPPGSTETFAPGGTAAPPSVTITLLPTIDRANSSPAKAEGDEGSGRRGLVLFVAVATLLGVLAMGAFKWRSGRGL